eukprot:CAMPEP_0172312200 /NCGR_PEP_ID=MMETSP1058-20130122/17014_1 /TAXON_ID=83371 /ORGANISM="Detonula confervacea, Strain CCMP 353" /LENGTH=348 /DNA_ID=CAMNT_0013025593 /DNA_START=40 /DNA_END=1086 /DNA_ORIENTATION=+
MTRLLCLSATLLVSAASTVFAASEFCPTMYADFHRRQLAHFSDEVFVLEEGASAKHIPFLTLSDDSKTGTIVVGNGGEEGGIWHPMSASDDPDQVHFVTHIMVKDQDGKVVILESMDPTVEAPATMTFAVPAGVTQLTPYEWCNLHGLWKGEPVMVPTEQLEKGSSAVCGASDYAKEAWPSVHADFMRQQKDTFNSTTPFTETDGVKHTPYITLKDDGTASILVGNIDVALHPMNGSPDGIAEPHWITEIYVVDQSGNIVAMSSLDDTGVDTATLDFEVPEGAESVQAYAWCNIHGLWKGSVVEVETTASDGEQSEIESSDGDAASATATASAGFAVGAALLVTLNML